MAPTVDYIPGTWYGICVGRALQSTKSTAVVVGGAVSAAWPGTAASASSSLCVVRSSAPSKHTLRFETCGVTNHKPSTSTCNTYGPLTSNRALGCRAALRSITSVDYRCHLLPSTSSWQRPLQPAALCSRSACLPVALLPSLGLFYRPLEEQFGTVGWCPRRFSKAIFQTAIGRSAVNRLHACTYPRLLIPAPIDTAGNARRGSLRVCTGAQPSYIGVS